MSVPDVPVEGNPFKSRTVTVPTGFSMEWSARAADAAGTPIPGDCKIGLPIAFNTKTLVIYNNDGTNGLAVRCDDTYALIDGGTGKFPSIVPGGLPADYLIVPAGGALTIAVGPVGDRVLVPAIYVQSLTASTFTASFICINTSGSLILGGA